MIIINIIIIIYILYTYNGENNECLHLSVSVILFLSIIKRGSVSNE